MSKKFTWDAWNFDSDGNAYIISKSVCPEQENVPDFIIREDNLDWVYCKQGIIDGGIKEGWCKYQIRSDWEDETEPHGGYYVTPNERETINKITGKRKSGWFPVWIVRQGEWY